MPSGTKTIPPPFSTQAAMVVLKASVLKVSGNLGTETLSITAFIASQGLFSELAMVSSSFLDSLQELKAISIITIKINEENKFRAFFSF